MTLDQLIAANIDYIQNNSWDESNDHYLSYAKIILERLERLKKGQKLPKGFDRSILDGFDPYAQFTGQLLEFIEKNPEFTAD